MSILSSVIGSLFGGNHSTPTPLGSPLANRPGSSLPVASPPGGSSGFQNGLQNSPFTEAQLQSAFSSADLGGVWDTIKGVGGDVLGVLGKVLPHNEEGGIDWGAIGSDIKGLGSFLASHKNDIVDALNIYNATQRQGKADQYAKDALDQTKAEYAAKQPLRDAGMAGMLNPKANAPNLSSLSAQGQQGAGMFAQLPPSNTGQAAGLANLRTLAGPGSGNPFAKALPVAGVQSPTMPSLPTPPSLPVAGPPGGTPGAPSSPYGNVPPGPPMTPIGPGGAPTTRQTQAKKDPKTGLYSPAGVSPNYTMTVANGPTMPKVPPVQPVPPIPVASPPGGSGLPPFYGLRV